MEKRECPLLLVLLFAPATLIPFGESQQLKLNFQLKRADLFLLVLHLSEMTSIPQTNVPVSW